METQENSIEVKEKKRNWTPIIAGVLSLVLPGVGQLYKAQIYKSKSYAGFVWFILVVYGYFMAYKVAGVFDILPFISFHIFCVVSAIFLNPIPHNSTKIFHIILIVVSRIIRFGLIFLFVLSFSFHWLPDYGYRIFPKESFSFKHTIISREDVDKLIEQHNEAGAFERAIIRNEYIHRQLVEMGIIVNKETEE